MKKLFALGAIALATAANAANFGTSTPPTSDKPAAAGTNTSINLAPSGPQATGMFRIVKPDGLTVVQQATLSASTTTLPVINVTDKDALVSSGGKCAFNVKYDEISATAATNTTNRLYSNDALVAQNTKIDLQANVLKSILTQPYLVAGTNNVRVVVNADSSAPSQGWVQVKVSGLCNGTTAPPPAAAPAPKPAPEPVVYQPGSAQWNVLNTAWGYTNYGVTQLKGKGYSRYDELVKLNAAITEVINAKKVDQATYNRLIASWNSFTSDATFKSLMAASTPGSDTPKTAPPAAKTVVVAPAPVTYKPGSAEWNNLNNAWGYSNYAVTQLKGSGYSRYGELVALNAAIGAIISAKSVEQSRYVQLIASWNSFVNDATFKAAMAAIVPPSGGTTK